MYKREKILQILADTEKGLTSSEIVRCLFRLGEDLTREPRGLMDFREVLDSLVNDCTITCERIRGQEIYRLK